MFFENMRTYTGMDSKLSLSESRREIEDLRTERNNKRCETLAQLLLIVVIVLIILDFIAYKPLWSSIPNYLYLYYSHIFIFVIYLTWLLLLRLSRIYAWKINNKVFNIAIYNFTMIWCVFMGLNSTRINGQISAYIVCIFCFAAFFYLNPIEGIILFGTYSMIFSVGLVLMIDNNKLLYSNIVNMLVALTLAQIGSKINYSAFVKDFLNKKSILQSKLELEAAYQKLNEYEILRTEFFTNISHELRTPLNVIYSAEQMINLSLQQRNINDENINKYLKMVKQNTNRLLRLINNLIDITKIEGSGFQIKLTNVDIVKTVEDIVMSVADFIESKGITLIFDTEVEEMIVAFDPDKIERIILNLLSNAVKFTDKGGTIQVYIFIESGSVCISVRDTGVGIAEDKQELIFNRFIQVDKSLKRTSEGSGIGLSLVKSLIEMHGGSISIKSKLGEGSEFVIKLPDVRLSESEELHVSSDLGDNHIDRVYIEFSDIYK